ncbi:MAG: class I SAM-dependent DNA methyltransferase [Selenomonadaceae bacterium]|nr:class I SAM-dependent DNA methyltransferase [Selenomonadaceae bacterium]
MNRIKDFVRQWTGRGYEKGETHTFWLSFLRDVFGIAEPEKYIYFEVPVKLKHTSFIDAFLPDTKVIIEQKSLSENLSQEKSQSDGSTLTPYEQAQRYGSSLPYSMRPRWIVVCNFAEFLIYDMETLVTPTKILLTELPDKFHAFDFLIDETKNKLRVELELSLKAGEIVGKLYDALHSQYINPDNEHSLASLNKLCVRLVFCLFAESSGIFGKHKIFRDWLEGSRNIRQDLILLFDVLNTPLELRDPYLDDTLKKFPYVNGGLFEGEIEIPNFTPEIKNLLLEEASSSFNWAGISPTIFGAVFESTLNPITRRAGGMHYNSVKNIHKVIDTLFLDDLHEELETIKQSARTRKKNLLAFQDKLAAIKIFDPACGSGNFLTESYLSLRRLENEVLKELLGGQIQLGELLNPIKISIGQFFGIEINDFAVAVAQTALWIAELQMIQETQEIIHRDLDFLPLKSYSNIHEGNALKLDWQNICPQPNFIIGNPPFVGARIMNSAQKVDINSVFDGWKNAGNLDYVSGWYKKAADFCRGKNLRAAFVATNSICQGDSVATLWRPLFNDVHIDFAHRTFRWDSESTQKAHVHCVIVGFSSGPNSKPKIIFDGDKKIIASNINAYLFDAPNIFVESRPNHLQDGVPDIGIGNKPIDDGNYLFTFDEMTEFIAHEPLSEKYFRKWYGAREFIKNEPRYCLLLKDCLPHELKRMPLVYQRVKNVREFRLNSKSAGTRKLADKPTRFHVENFPSGNYLLIPRVSSENRIYVPIGFMNEDSLASDSVHIVPNATLYHFGVLTSSIHMIWLRTVGGRMEVDYRYSKNIVYNNFVWQTPTPAQISAIEQSAQAILDIRASLPDSSFAELYDEVTMPYDLRQAHRKNDLAVARAYGWEKFLDDETSIAVELLKLYQNQINPL